MNYWEENHSVNTTIQKILEVAGFDEEDHYLGHGEWYEGKPEDFREIQFLGVDSEISMVGINLIERFKVGKNMEDVRREFVYLIRKIAGVDVDPELVDIYYGEVGSG